MVSNNFLIFVPFLADVSIYANLFSSQNFLASENEICLLLSLSNLLPTTIIYVFSGTFSDISFNHVGSEINEFLSIIRLVYLLYHMSIL
jgi:hypothetical protein